jgi:hypothetical protein
MVDTLTLFSDADPELNLVKECWCALRPAPDRAADQSVGRRFASVVVTGKGGTMQKRALVVGLGIAGMSAAIGLRRAGWTPVI